MTPRFQVDFNELVEHDLVLLSQTDIRLDVRGKPVQLLSGMAIEVIEDDPDISGASGLLIANGVAEPNVGGPNWAQAAAWCCRIDARGIRREAPN